VGEVLGLGVLTNGGFYFLRQGGAFGGKSGVELECCPECG
jgi:hypothetical protein